MKKSLLALAVLGAFAVTAQAQTNVTIGGVVQANVKSYSVGNTTRPSTNELRVDDDYNSRFWLTGTEDLGGGNSGIFYIENRLSTDVNNVQATGNGLANGDTWVGLKGGWGQVTVGKHSWMSVQGLTTELVAAKGLSAMPTSMLGTYSILNQAGGYLDITRRNNSITYRLPAMSGFNGTVGYSAASAGNEGNLACTGTGLTAIVSVVPAAGSTTQTATCPQLTSSLVTTGNYTAGSEFYLQGGYANGPLSASLAYRNQRAEGRTGLDDRQIRFSGFYKIPMGLKVGLQLDRATRTTIATGGDVSRTAWSLPVSYVMGNSAILASYTRAGDRGGVANTGAKMYMVGFDYALSARTNAGVYYSKLNNDSAGIYQPFLAGTSFTGSGLAAGESASTLAVGVKHTF